MNEIELRKKYELEVTQKYMEQVAININQSMARYDKDCDNAYNRQLMEQYGSLVYQENGKIKVSKSGCASLFAGYFMSNFNNGEFCISKALFNLIYIPNNIKIIHLNNRIEDEVSRLRWKYLDNINSKYCIYKKIESGLNEFKLQLRLQDKETLDMIEYLGIDEFCNMASVDMSGLTKLFDKFFKDIQPLKKLLDERYKKLNW